MDPSKAGAAAELVAVVRGSDGCCLFDLCGLFDEFAFEHDVDRVSGDEASIQDWVVG